MNMQTDAEGPVVDPDGTQWTASTDAVGWTPRRQARTHDQVKADIARARDAATILRETDPATKDRALLAMADTLLDRGREILAANEHDVSTAANARSKERLMLSRAGLSELAEELRSWVALPNPVGELLSKNRRSDGVERHQVRVPIGVIAVLYEEQVLDGIRALGPLLKTGNAVLLRGSRSAAATGEALVTVVQDAVAAGGLPPAAVQLVSSTHRVSMIDVITARGGVDLLIPLLGPGMRAGVVPDATVPLLDIVRGKSHIYVDAAADLVLAEQTVLTSKVGHSGLTTTVGTILVHGDIAEEFLPMVSGRLREFGISVHGDARCLALVPDRIEPSADDWHVDRGDSGVAIAVVTGLEDALRHIATYGTGHVDAVITADGAVAEAFTTRVDSATVAVNAPTTLDTRRGVAEPCLAYAAGRLAPRGPLGLTEFTTTQWIVVGDHGATVRPMRRSGVTQ